MSSAAQVTANRANAAHSTGPSTDAGKATSRLNATRHGLNSQVACMPWEDRGAFHQFCSALVAEYRPEGVIETELAQSIAEDHWRLNRLRAIEHNIFALGIATSRPEIDSPAIDSNDPQIHAALTQAQTFCDQAKTLGLLTLYEQRINRSVHRNLDRLRRHQSERREAREQALAIFAERRSEERKAAIRSSEAQPNGSGLIPTERPQQVKSLAIGFVHSNNKISGATRGRSLSERIAQVEFLMAERQIGRAAGLKVAA